MINGYKVIDADAHMQEPADLWDKYVEKEFYDRRPKVTNVEYQLFFKYESGELYPKALPEFLNQPINDESKRKVLWDNPVRLFGERIVN